MPIGRRRVQATVLAVVLSGFLSTKALAADTDPGAEVAAPALSLPAVDGVNAKVSGFGGTADGRALYGGEGSVTVPLGFQHGLQIDGVVAGFENEFQGTVAVASAAGHLFWRNPSVGLIGAYGRYQHANGVSAVDVFAGAAEGALYVGRFTLEGAAGVDGGRINLGGSSKINISTRFFDFVFLSYYPTDDLKLSIGHSLVRGENALLLGAEWGFSTGRGIMAALYTQGGVFENGGAGVLAGLRLYFGQHDKTLIRRHREDDPVSLPTLSIVQGDRGPQ